ncbi:MAG: lipopolysaccharide assembly protein LapA domain-containing protein [Thermoleophilia bacterium]
MSEPQTPQKSERKPYILLVVVAVILVYLLAFALVNTQQVHVSFVVFATDTALIWVMAACAGLGLVLGILGTSLLLHRRHR